MNIQGALVYTIAALSNTGEALLIIGKINEQIKPQYYFLLNILMICGKYEFIGYFLIFNKIFKVRKLI